MGNVALGLSYKWMPEYSGDNVANTIDGVVGMASQFTSKIGKNKKSYKYITNAQTSSAEAYGTPNDNTLSNGVTELNVGNAQKLTPDYSTNNPFSTIPKSYTDKYFSKGGRLNDIHKLMNYHRYDNGQWLEVAKSFGSSGGSSGSSMGLIADGADQMSQLAAKSIGNVYGDKHDPWANNVRTIAYGNADDNTLFSKSQRRYVNGFSKDLRNKDLAQVSNATTSAGLMNDINKQSENFANGVNDVSGGKKFLAANMASWQGAGKGGKWASQLSGGNTMATAAGWIIGGLAGLGRGIGKAINGKKYLRQLNRAIDARNAYTDRSINDSVNNFGVRQNNQLSANWIGANGGELPLAGRIHSTFHKFANGGKIEQKESDDISQSKDQFHTGITEINAGGSHEENPNGGVQQGIAPDGLPNLVEEGEVKISDITGKSNQYILSNRVVIDEQTAEQFGIDKQYIGLTFADAFRKAYKPLKERPNDPITKNELASLINNFQQGQEFIKQQQEAQMQAALAEQLPQPTPEEQQAAAYDQGAQDQAMNDAAMDEQMAAEQQMAQQEQAMPIMARGGKMCAGKRIHNAFHKYATGGHLFYDGGEPNQSKWIDKKIEKQIEDLYGSVSEFQRLHNLERTGIIDDDTRNAYTNKHGVTKTASTQTPVQGLKRIGDDENPITNQPAQSVIGNTTSTTGEKPVPEVVADNKAKSRSMADAWGLRRDLTMRNLMQAPALNSIRNVLDRDKYINPDKYDKYYEDNKRLLHDEARRVAYQNSPRYVDPNYIMSKVRSIGDTGARSLQNMYSGHGAAAAAAMMAQNQRVQNALSENAIKALEYNNALRMQDLQMRQQAAQFNAQAQNAINMQNDQLRTKANEELAQTHASADQLNKQTRTAAFANMAKNLGTLGRYYDNRARQFVVNQQTPGAWQTDADMYWKYLNDKLDKNGQPINE